MNIDKAVSTLQWLASQGVKEIILCPGARNSPLVSVLERVDGVSVLPFFEERSAAFFALGRVKSTSRPVAVCTTSGTAVAELLPACIEAHYSGAPLIFVTADRPPRLRGTGAPQTIEQIGLFGSYVEWSWDVRELSDFATPMAWSGNRPVHLNVCFAEPLIDKPVPVLQLQPSKASAAASVPAGACSEFFTQSRKPCFVAGALTPAEKELVVEALLQNPMPGFAEAMSGLREDPRISHLLLKSGDRFLQQTFADEAVDGVIRFGSVPTLRLWRDLDGKLSHVPVLNVSSLPFSGLGRDCFITAPASVRGFHSTWTKQELAELMEFDRVMAGRVESLCEKYPSSEPALVRALSGVVPESSTVYLGNSLPIREWDLFALHSVIHGDVAANRGANGIDGQISTFFGYCKPGMENWAVVGDLTALYDLAAPWATKFLPDISFRLVVLNNRGGQIFSRMFESPLFLNEHDLQFSHWAGQWKLHYEKWHSVPRQAALPRHAVIELCPEAEPTKKFWREYEALFAETKT